MMFKSDDDGNPLDVSLIDFQGPFWAGPGVDLFYFILTSVADDLKIDQFDNIVKFYHDELTKALKKLNYDAYIPTLAEVHTDLLDKGAFGEMSSILKMISCSYVYFAACCCLFFILAIAKYEAAEEINLDRLLMDEDNSELLKKFYNNENYKKALKLWLPFLNERGFLDCLIKTET